MDNQTVFKETYICSTEIIKKLNVTRATLSRAISRGLMPKPIVISNGATRLWLREEAEPILKEWSKTISKKRSV